MNRLTLGIVVVLFSMGCISLTPDEKQVRESIIDKGYSLANPPKGFVTPVSANKAAGLNALLGIGNFYLANHDAGAMQWALGVGNLLLWPFSPIWAIYQGYADAETVNTRELVRYWEKHPEVRRTRAPNESGSSLPKPPSPPPSRPYDFETVAPYSNGTAKFLVTILDENRTDLKVHEEISPKLQKMVYDQFTAEMSNESNVRVLVVPDFKDRKISYTVTAFLANPIEDEWSYKYTAATKRGYIRLRDRGDVYRDWAIKNIAKIVGDKNVIIDSDSDTIPPGAKFQLLDDELKDGFRTITFEAVE